MAKKKAYQERRVERITWALLVWIVVVQVVLQLPGWALPLAAGIILLGSALYQTSRGWRVNPVTWLAGFALLFIGLGGPVGILTFQSLPMIVLVIATVFLLAVVSREA